MFSRYVFLTRIITSSSKSSYRSYCGIGNASGSLFASSSNTTSTLRMSSPSFVRHHSYDEAIRALNGLQTNAALLEKIRKERQKNVHLNLPKTLRYLDKSGMTLEQLDQLRTIHVSGTKGKGSTCAFTESILLRQGLKTGFFSSPHLVTANERIRISGKPISQEKFTHYFWSVYEKICQDPEDRPPYFQFLTILAFNVFHAESVDVAIIECGIGGTYDHTNIIRRPTLTAITSQGIDHRSLLGHTIEENSSHKAGILKEGVECFVDHDQHEVAMIVYRDRAQSVGAKGPFIAPRLEEYDWGRFPEGVLGLTGEVQKKNASIALQLSRAFLAKTSGQEVRCEPFKISLAEALGLRLCAWPGRSQVVSLTRDVVFFLDGAHTKESSQACSAWFSTASPAKSKDFDPVYKVLIFNVYDERKGDEILAPLVNLGFDLVIFCTNFSRRPEEQVSDNINFTATLSGQFKKCQENVKHWERIQSANSTSVPCILIPYLNDAVAWVTQGRRLLFLGLHGQEEFVETDLPTDCSSADQIQVLVTGSTHLVGGVLEIICPDVFFQSELEIKEEQRIVQEYESLDDS